MGAVWAIAILLAACTGEEHASLVLEGPDRVTVEALGEVDGPAVVLEDGTTPEGVVWESTRPEVAAVEGSRVTAVAPGEALIQGTWRNQTVVWHLVVDPAVAVRFVEPKLSLAVGDQQAYAVEVTIGDAKVEPGALEWSAKPPAVLTVDAATGQVHAVGPGKGWIVVRQGDAEAMVEVVVTD